MKPERKWVSELISTQLLAKARVRKVKDPHGRRIRGKKRVLPGGRNRIAKETGQSPNGLKGRRGKQPVKIGKKSKVPMDCRGKGADGPQNLGRRTIGVSRAKVVWTKVVPIHPTAMRGIIDTINITRIHIIKMPKLSIPWLKSTSIGMSMKFRGSSFPKRF